MVKAVIFDLDGTIANTIPLCIKAFRESIEPLINRSITDLEIINTFGPSEEGTIKILTPDHYDKAFTNYLINYEKLHNMCPLPFEGIKELLETLKQKGLRIAMVTGKGKYSTDITLKHLNILNYFEIIKTGSQKGPNKVEGIQSVLDSFSDLNKNEIIYVGDAPNDIISSRKAGISVISAGWADSTEIDKLKELNPDKLFCSVTDFANWLYLNI